MREQQRDRPWGDDAFEDPRRRGLVATAWSILMRSVTTVLAGIDGRAHQRQLPLDPPQARTDYRP
ncbi:hypothetical protein [Curtobacterium sp. ME26]|uniref:hypothetical protein n=1 Tax=Curtobacterium sp. ME26 TaxID=2744254 RepID=UPI0015F6422F|nr:hypothetical protein [Curtobacterium sp. ME26]